MRSHPFPCLNEPGPALRPFVVVGVVVVVVAVVVEGQGHRVYSDPQLNCLCSHTAMVQTIVRAINARQFDRLLLVPLHKGEAVSSDAVS